MSAAVGGAALGDGTPGRVRPSGGLYRDVREFGAIGDGNALDTIAIQQAIDATHAAGGGAVWLPPGAWRCGTLHLHSHVTLELGPGAVLCAAPDDDAFDARERLPFPTGSDHETTDFAHALISGCDLERVAIRGAGVIDMGRRWRGGPKALALKRCRFVTVQGVTILHAPNYCVSLAGCEDVVIEGVTIREAYADGIDPDCCRRVRVTNCDIESDDDALCLKASFALGHRGTTEDVVVSNCRLSSPSNCFKLGTESTGDFRQIALTNCVLSGAAPEGHDARAAAEGGGVALLAVDGGSIEGVVVTGVVMRDVAAPLFVRLGDRGRDQAVPGPGRLRNVTISGLLATGARGTAAITGLPGYPVEHLTLSDVRIHADGGAAARGLDVPECAAHYPTPTMYGALPGFGLYIRHARDVRLRDVALTAEHRDGRPALVADDVTGLRADGLSGDGPAGAAPVAWLHDVRDARVQGDQVRVTGKSFDAVALAEVDPAAPVGPPDGSRAGSTRTSRPRRPN